MPRRPAVKVISIAMEVMDKYRKMLSLCNLELLGLEELHNKILGAILEEHCSNEMSFEYLTKTIKEMHEGFKAAVHSSCESHWKWTSLNSDRIKN